MAVTLHDNLRVGGAKAETVQGTAETIAAAQCVRFIDPVITPANGLLEDPSVRTTKGTNQPLLGGRTAEVSLGWKEKGSGTAGTAIPQPLVDIHEACKMTQTNKTTFDSYLVGSADNSITVQVIKGVEVGSTGKAAKARGVKGNLVTTLEPGKFVTTTFTGPGILENLTDATVLAASAEDSTVAPALIGETMIVGEYHAACVEATDGTAEKIADGAASNVKLALSFTQSGNARVVGYALNLEKVGTPANETNGLTVSINTDDGGDPSGTDLTLSSASVATSLIDPDDPYWHYIIFDRGSRASLADGIDYHLVVTGDWDADPDNCVAISVDAVEAGSQTCKFYDAAWAALALKNISVLIFTVPTTGDNHRFGPSEINLNNEAVVDFDDPGDAQGCSEAEIGGTGNVTWTISPRTMLQSELDLYAYYTSKTDLFVFAQAGSTTGNIVQWIGSHVRPHDASMAERNNRPVTNLTLAVDRDITNASFEKRYL